MQHTMEYEVMPDRNEILRYIGMAGSADAVDGVVARQINECMNSICQTAVPRYTYGVFDMNDEFHRGSGPFSAEFGNDVRELFNECSKYILMAVTIGHQVDAAIRRAQIKDMTTALILDSCASSAVESICNQLNSDLEQNYLNKGLYLTDRFSPGYGDMPIRLQEEICEILSTEKRIGLAVTSSLTLTPLKSVTAVIGISNKPQPMKISGCANCKLQSECKFRKAGETCVQQK